MRREHAQKRGKMKKGEIYSGIVERVEFPNKGIIHTENGDIRIKGCLPGQTVQCVIKSKKSGKAEGSLQEVIKTSPLETEEPVCHLFGVCGGCSYQTLPYKEQLKLKEQQVKKLLDAVIKEPYEWDPVQGSPESLQYRNKMEYSFGDERKDGPLTLGLHKLGSFYDILTTDDCKIVDEDFNLIVSAVLQLCSSFKIPYYHKMTQKGFLRHLVIRRTKKQGEILVHLVTTSQYEGISDGEDTFLEMFKNTVLKLQLGGTVTGILHSVNDGLADMVRSDDTSILYGRDAIYEELLGLCFKITTFSFFQTNSLGAEVLYGKARDYIGDTKDKVLFDLYSGTGTIAQLMAAVAKKVVGVEIVEEAVEAARENAALNHLDNCEFIAGDVLKVLDIIEEKPDLILLDQPRDGINPKALNKIIEYNVDRMVYISCKPTSLARDLEVLQERGYKVIKAGCVDMFPQTVHVETIVALHRKDT